MGDVSNAELCGYLALLSAGLTVAQFIPPAGVLVLGVLIWDVCLGEWELCQRVGQMLGCCTHPLTSESIIKRLEAGF